MNCPLIVCVKVLGPLIENETEVPSISQSQRMNCLSPQLVCEKNHELPELEEELKKKSQLKKQRKKINRVLDMLAML